MSYSLDSRNENVQLDYNKLKISSDTQFTKGLDFANTGFTMSGGLVMENSGTNTVIDGAINTAYSLNTFADNVYMVEYTLIGVCTSGAQSGKAIAQQTVSRVKNIGGVVTPTLFFSNINNIDAGVTASQNFAVVGQTLNFLYSGAVGCTYKFTWSIKIWKTF